jgi:uncharacterized protein (DUF1800 family)
VDFTRADVGHLLRRAGFGAPTADVESLLALPDWAAVVERVLDTSANPPDVIPAGIEDRANPWYPPWVVGVQYWTDRMATTPTPIVEKMTLFWHGLFTSSVDKLFPRLVFKQIRTYRRLALGDLHELAQAMALDPAMLLYLDNESNVAGRPNQNFARELMELFLLGRGDYAEADVDPMARAWTGHGYDSVNEVYRWNAARHDGGAKTIFGVTRNWDGPETITEMVRGSKQAVCARYIAGKLWAFLAGPAPAPATLDALAASFVAANMEIKALVRAIFLHPDFRAPATKTGLVRSPVEWMVATMKVLGLPAATVHPEWWVERCGQRLYAPPNVGGWRGNEGWVATSTSWGRGSFASNVRWHASKAGIFAGYGDLAPATAVDRALTRFGIADASPVTRAALEAYVAGEKAARRSWAVQPNLVALCMLTPDFQMA